MQLHRFEVEHHHGAIGDPDDRPYGNGVLLWFEIDDFDAAVARGRSARRRGRAAASTATRRRATGRTEPLGDLAARPRRLHRRAGEPRRGVTAPGRLTRTGSCGSVRPGDDWIGRRALTSAVWRRTNDYMPSYLVVSVISLHLDTRSGVPPYLQIAQQVRHALVAGVLKPGDQLPTVKEVVTQLAVNPNTVFKGYRELEREGLVEGRPGAGTFVLRRPVRSPSGHARRAGPQPGPLGRAGPAPPGSTTGRSRPCCAPTLHDDGAEAIA